MEINKNAELKKCRRLPVAYAESSCEFTLPDYLGDVKKILITKADVKPAGRFVDGESVELPGIVSYNVVYLDSDGDISSVGFSSEYDVKVKCPSDGFVDIVSETEMSAATVRLVGPRKFSAKSTVKASPRILECVNNKIEGNAFEKTARPEKASKRINLESFVCSSTLEREFSESVARIDGAIADEVKIIFPRADARIDTVTASEGEATVKGELKLSAILKNGDEPAYPLTRSIPFEETVPFDGVSPDTELSGRADVVSVTGSVNADDSGSEIVLSVITEFYVIGVCNSSAEVITDAYMTACVTENIYDDMRYTELTALGKERFTCQGETDRGTMDIGDIREILCMDAVARIDSAESCDEGVQIGGEILFSGICSETENDGSTTYIGVKFATPFSQNVKCNCQIWDKNIIEPKISIHSATGLIDTEKIYGSCDVTIEVLTSAERCERVLSSSVAREELPYEKRGSTVTVYYPSRGESLFTVAKRFHTTAAAIAENNSLSEAVIGGDTVSELVGVKRLLIF